MKDKDITIDYEGVVFTIMVICLILSLIAIGILFSLWFLNSQNILDKKNTNLCSHFNLSYSNQQNNVGAICYKTLNNQTIRYKILNINNSLSLDVNPMIEVNK